MPTHVERSTRMKRWKWLVAVACLGVLLTGCGGDGGADSGSRQDIVVQETASPAVFSIVSGTVSPEVTSSRDYSSHKVRLIKVDGANRVLLDEEMAEADGSFRLAIGTARGGGLDLQAEVETPSGEIFRAYVLNDTVFPGKGSEAFVQALNEAMGRPGSSVSVDLTRWAAFQAASTQFLEAIGPNLSGQEPDVETLKSHLQKDPAASQALRAIRDSGRLPPTLGDIGHMDGLLRSAWFESSTLGTGLTYYMMPVAGQAGAFEVNVDDGNVSQALKPYAVYRLKEDSIVAAEAPGLDAFSNYLLASMRRLFGEIRTAKVGSIRGHWHLLNIKRARDASPVDSDNQLDDFAYTSSQKVDGMEQVEAMGRQVRALRKSFHEELVINFSDGRSFKVSTTGSTWSVPYAGHVRRQARVVVWDLDGTRAETGFSSTIDFGTFEQFEWPAALFVKITETAYPGLGRPARTMLAATRDQGVIVLDEGSPNTLRKLALDAENEKVRVELAGTVTDLRLSPDRSKLYVIRDLRHGASRTHTATTEALAQSSGAELCRYSMESLRLEVCTKAPPIASPTNPGLYFPRDVIQDILISPRNADTVAISATGLLHFDGTQWVESNVPSSSLLRESMFEGQTTAGFDDYITLEFWDKSSDQLHFGLYSDSAFFVDPANEARRGLRLAHFDGSRLVTSWQASSAQWLVGGRYSSSNAPHMDRVAFQHDDLLVMLDDFVLLNPRDRTIAREMRYGGACASAGFELLCIQGGDLEWISPGDMSLQNYVTFIGFLRGWVAPYLVSPSPRFVSLVEPDLLVGAYPHFDLVNSISLSRQPMH